MPCNANTDSIMTEPLRIRPNWTADSATTGMIALRRACLKRTVNSRRPFAPRGPDIVRRQHLQHAGSCQPHNRGHGVVGQGDRRHHKVFPGSGARDREPPQLDAQVDHHQQSKPERRKRQPGNRQGERQSVVPRPRPQRRQHAQWKGEQEREEYGSRAELEGNRKAFGNKLRDRLLEEERGSQIALDGASDPVQVLNDDRSVQAIVSPHGLDGFGRCPRPGERHREVSRQLEQREGNGRDRQRDENRHQDSPDRKLDHFYRRFSTAPRETRAAQRLLPSGRSGSNVCRPSGRANSETRGNTVKSFCFSVLMVVLSHEPTGSRRSGPSLVPIGCMSQWRWSLSY